MRHPVREERRALGAACHGAILGRHAGTTPDPRMCFELFSEVGPIEDFDAKDSSRSSSSHPDTSALRHVNEHKSTELFELHAEVIVARPSLGDIERRASWLGAIADPAHSQVANLGCEVWMLPRESGFKLGGEMRQYTAKQRRVVHGLSLGAIPPGCRSPEARESPSGRPTDRNRNGSESSEGDTWLVRFRDGEVIEYHECDNTQEALDAVGAGPR